MLKNVLMYCVLFLAIVNTYFLYFYEGFAPEKTQSIWAFITIAILAIIGIFFLFYQISFMRSAKKTLLRLMLLLGVILFISSLYSRATELFDYPLILWRWLQTLLYGVIILLVIAHSYGFYNKLRAMVKKQENYFN